MKKWHSRTKRLATVALNKCYLLQLFSSFKGMVFLASSFDDASFRVLGKGRTFYLQIQDAKVDSISHQQCRTIERIINAAKGLRVKNLKQADKYRI
jgi:tRNA U54 and U55 pseudouridine synthase Pus10